MRTRRMIGVLSLAMSVPLCGCIFEDNDRGRDHDHGYVEGGDHHDRDHDRDHCDHDRDHCDH